MLYSKISVAVWLEQQNGCLPQQVEASNKTVFIKRLPMLVKWFHVAF